MNKLPVGTGVVLWRPRNTGARTNHVARTHGMSGSLKAESKLADMPICSRENPATPHSHPQVSREAHAGVEGERTKQDCDNFSPVIVVPLTMCLNYH